MFTPAFTISDVAKLLSIERLTNGTNVSFNAVCPFCGDRRGKMNLCIYRDGELKNTYHCFNCGAGGNMLQLYAELNGFQGADRCRKAYHEIRGRLRNGEGGAYRTDPKRMEEQCVKVAAMEASADLENRDAVYRALLSMLHLKEKHRAAFRKRGLTETQIDQMEAMGFVSTRPGETESLTRRLLAGGCRLEGVPGFYLGRNRSWKAAFYSYNEGILCPAWSRKGKLTGFQIRLDMPYKGMKYTWLTSTGREKGCSSKSPSGYFGDPDTKVLYVTEGILKAAAAYLATGKTFLGNPGVGQYREMEGILREMKQNGLQAVFECYDMDKKMRIDCKRDYDSGCAYCEEGNSGAQLCRKKRRKREEIRKGCVHLYRICEELSLKCARVTWDVGDDGMWNGSVKGVDDWKLEERETRFLSRT